MKRPHIRFKRQTRRERTWTIHLIAAEKVIKATALLIVAAKLLTLFNRDVQTVFADFVTRHGVDIGNRFVHSTIERLTGIGNSQIIEISSVAAVYATLLYVEGIGLWLQKRWAEYLTTISTALFIPLEIYELFERFTWVRIALLAINIFIVWYLATRLKDEKSKEAPVSEVRTPLVKICGITNVEDAKQAADAGADALGFNFYEKSSRFISAEDAAAITAAVPGDVFKVGIFVDHSHDEIIEIVETVGLDGVQLHGNESVEFVKGLRAGFSGNTYIIKALRVGPGFDPAAAHRYEVDAILLDTFNPDEMGGTGETFDWEITDKFRELVADLYLAGGLSELNVGDAVSRVSPFAVDACSRLESEPGKKDHQKVTAFIKAAKKGL